MIELPNTGKEEAVPSEIYMPSIRVLDFFINLFYFFFQQN